MNCKIIRQILFLLSAAGFILSSAAIMGLFPGCLLSDLQTVSVVLPPLPPEWGAAGQNISAELVFYSEGKSETVSGLSFGDKKDIEVEKGIVPFAAYPVLKDYGIRLKPGGGIFPENYDGEELEISWQNGFAAETVLYLSEKGADFSNFNIGRFEKVLCEKSGGNPWKISETAVLYSLSSGIFNSNHVSVKQSFCAELSSDFLNGEWYFDYPPESRIITEEEGVLTFDSLFPGHHFLVSREPGELKYAELFIDNEKWTAFFSSGEGGLSGRF